MLNIELIRFEAQDVITASGVVECTCVKAACQIANIPGTNVPMHDNCEAKEHKCGY